MAKDTKATMLDFELARDANGNVDVAASVKNAEKSAKKYAETDKQATTAVVNATKSILANEKHKEEKSFTTTALGTMVLGVLGVVPNTPLVAETEQRIKAFMIGQPDFLHVPAGRNAGFHIKSRYQTAEEKATLEKITKAAAESAAK